MSRPEAKFHGILCIDKPTDFTSFDVVAKLRGMIKQKRIGHGGTLDPFATGVLPLFLGRATRLCDMAPVQDKTYVVTLALGLTTDTQDSTGQVIAQSKSEVTREQLERVLTQFCGDILQLPPMYSAVQIDGKRLYDLARKGIEVERESRPITVHSIRMLSFDTQRQEAELEISCSAGTYIRTICHDVGQALGVGGIAKTLRRTEALGFTLSQCHTFEGIAQALERGEESFAELLLPMESLFLSYPALRLGSGQDRMFKNGVKLNLSRINGLPKACDTPIRVQDNEGNFMGLAKASFDDDLLVAWKILA